MRVRSSWVLVATFTLGFSFGCDDADDDEPQPLTCELLEDPGNCWATAAAAAAACIPSGEVAVLAADRASCSFSDGSRVVFDAPLPTTTEELEQLGFVLERDGSTCARFLDTFENRIELDVGSASVFTQLRGETYTLDCGDGSSYSMPFEMVFQCTPGTAPTDAFQVESALVSFSLSAVTTPGELFRCEP